ncbi:MAG: glutamine--fructose-6-phosphate transaminase (isomerizing) [Gammaproteobacteria bacterium]|nr:glutamine--fructose-6-phosphate transaminase (isomerizing) [Gammaproteobacteria bacterium]
MCGIVGAVSNRNIVPLLIDGLKRLEYRGYDSAGVAVLDKKNNLLRERAVGKVKELESCVEKADLKSTLGIAHTRWATHGMPSEVNAHPHFSNERVAVVHNGIIENYRSLSAELINDGYVIESETDSEIVAHLIDREMINGASLFESLQKTVKQLEGAYAIAVISYAAENEIVACRKGSPLVVGIADNENLIASDAAALISITNKFIYLNEGDFVRLNHSGIEIFDALGQAVEYEIKTSNLKADAVGKGDYQHYMLKEIHEQASAILECLEGRVSDESILPASFGAAAENIFPQVKNIQIIACGTSYHAGKVAQYWLEEIAGISCHVEVASEYRYRKHLVPENTLFVTLSQSGETADTLAALRDAVSPNFIATLTICNVPESSIVRESDLSLLTRAGPEIGVASTKAFTTQLVALMLLVLALGKGRSITKDVEAEIVKDLLRLPQEVEKVLDLDQSISDIAGKFSNKKSALFLGRGEHYPIAMEGALKLKEISYIHAEAYPAGELKHGPIALIDSEIPVVAVAPNDRLLEKLRSNMQEVKARGAELLVFAYSEVANTDTPADTMITIDADAGYMNSVLSVIPLQLLAYYVALLRGTDVDQPRNLAKSVTVE